MCIDKKLTLSVLCPALTCLDSDIDVDNFLSDIIDEYNDKGHSISRVSLLLIEQIFDKFCIPKNHPDIGLIVTDFLDKYQFKKLGFNLSSEISIFSIIELCIKLYRLISESATYDINCNERRIRVCFNIEHDAGESYQARNEMLILGICQLLRTLAGSDPSAYIAEIGFSFTQPAYRHLYRRFVSSPIHFSTQNSYIEFDTAILSELISQINLHAQIKNDGKRNLQELGASSEVSFNNNLAVQIKHYFRDLIDQEIPSKTDMAKVLGISLSTLTRKLADEGTSYMQIIDEIKLARAQWLLIRQNYSIARIAGLLGFTSRKGFELAFIRWTGITPVKYRKQQSAQLDDFA